MSIPELPPAETVALFLDFDGTLVEIAEHPDAVALDEKTKAAISSLSTILDNAVAIVTGREIEVIDRFMAPLRLPVAGIHGLTRRNAAGLIPHREGFSSQFVDELTRRLTPFAEQETGLLLEAKAASVALHYRARPELADKCLAACEEAISGLKGVELKRGKMVLEMKPNTANKGTAVIDFLAEPPFAGRTPWFAGDDVTDEDAFKVVNRLGGVSIKVGDGETSATYRTDNTARFLDWLVAAAEKMRAEGKT